MTLVIDNYSFFSASLQSFFLSFDSHMTFCDINCVIKQCYEALSMSIMFKLIKSKWEKENGCTYCCPFVMSLRMAALAAIASFFLCSSSSRARSVHTSCFNRWKLPRCGAMWFGPSPVVDPKMACWATFGDPDKLLPLPPFPKRTFGKRRRGCWGSRCCWLPSNPFSNGRMSS